MYATTADMDTYSGADDTLSQITVFLYVLSTSQLLVSLALSNFFSI